MGQEWGWVREGECGGVRGSWVGMGEMNCCGRVGMLGGERKNEVGVDNGRESVVG